MTYNWYDTRASTWYEGYGHDSSSSADGSFVDIRTLSGVEKEKALDSITRNVLGVLERQGITSEQAKKSQAYKDAMAAVNAGDTKGAFQGAAASVSSAAPISEGGRGDIWGATVAAGGDDARGKSFLAGITADSDVSLVDLYEKGFGREADTEGLGHWQEQLDSGMDIGTIAGHFLDSEETSSRDKYHEQYGRDADLDGLAYWMSGGTETSWDEMVKTDAHNIDDSSKQLEASMTYRGPAGEATSARDKVFGTTQTGNTFEVPAGVQAETFVRDEFRDALGQSSRLEDRHTKFGGTNDKASPYFTAPEHGDVMGYVNTINNAYKSGGEAAGDDAGWQAITDINMRMTGMDAYSQGDQDDYFAAHDINGDGEIDSLDEAAGGVTNDPTYMSRFATQSEIRNLQQEFKDAGGTFSIDGLPEDVNTWTKEQRAAGHPGMQDFLEFGFKKVMGDKWDALTHEKTKTLDDLVGIVPHGELIPEHAEKLLAKENLPGHVEKSDKLKSSWNQWATPIPGVTTGIGQDGWRPDIPDKPTKPTPLPVDRKDINYMPKFHSDVQDTSGYGDAKTKFDQALTAAAPDARTAQGTAGQRFTGTSAKGVRMKRSKRSKMGTIGGTKQLSREQQTKSLNI